MRDNGRLSGIGAKVDVQARGGSGRLSDEQLDHRAQQFIFYQVRDMLGITFERFLVDPDYYLNKVCAIVIAALDVSECRERETRNIAAVEGGATSHCSLFTVHSAPDEVPYA